MDLTVIILAAGKGKRMNSELPKVLHKLAGRPMVAHLLHTLSELGANDIRLVANEEVIAHKESECLQKITDFKFIEQKERLGTAHAAQCALKGSKPKGPVLILNGDVPLVEVSTLKHMLDIYKNSDDIKIVNLGFEADDPTGYGRLISYSGDDLIDIVEHKDATPEQKEINLCNSGTFLVDNEVIGQLLDKVDNNNAQKEYYLTDMVRIANNEGMRCSFAVATELEMMGINDKVQLSQAESVIQDKLCMQAMKDGVTMIAPETVFLSADTKFGKDVTIYPNVVIGEGVKIGDNVNIQAFSHIEGAIIGDNAKVGPFARLRPGTELEQNVSVGNFVETKKAHLKEGTKACHLSYIGDATIGEGTNIGAGTIFCNYDGYEKHHTTVGKHTFIGSNSALVAPVEIGEQAIIGAGSVITEDVEDNDLSIARARQTNFQQKATLIRKKKVG